MPPWVIYATLYLQWRIRCSKKKKWQSMRRNLKKPVVPNNFPLFRGKCQQSKARAVGDGKGGIKKLAVSSRSIQNPESSIQSQSAVKCLNQDL